MKITMYGANICTGCVEAKAKLAGRNDHDITIVDIVESTANLKEFLSYRDKEEMFEPIKEAGRIGIPFFVLEDGTKTFDVFEYIGEQSSEVISDEKAILHTVVEQEDTSYHGSACSLDGKGNC